MTRYSWPCFYDPVFMTLCSWTRTVVDEFELDLFCVKRLRWNNLATSLPSKKILHWASVCFNDKHAIAQPCRCTVSEAFQAGKSYVIYNKFGMLQVRENEIWPHKMIWRYCAFTHLGEKIVCNPLSPGISLCQSRVGGSSCFQVTQRNAKAFPVTLHCLLVTWFRSVASA